MSDVTTAMASRAACGRCASPVELDDLRCAICGLCTEPTSADELPARSLAKILRCKGCGAALAYDVEAHAPKCAFCASVLELEQPTDPVEQADWTLPFAVTPEGALGMLRKWLDSLGHFRPSHLGREITLQSMQPLAWAAWIVDATALVSWAADSDAGSQRSRWAPHAGQTALDFTRLLISASRGLTSEETQRLARHFDLSHARPIAGRSEGAVERFEAQRSVARGQITRAIEATAAARLQEGVIPGSTFRNVRVAVVLQRLVTRRVALPTYVMAYRYRGKAYRALVHGQDARLVFGDAPYSWGKIALAILGGVLLLMFVLWILSNIK